MWCNTQKSIAFLSILFCFAVSAKRANFRYTEAKIFTENHQSFSEKYRLVDQAKSHLDLSYFIIENDYSTSLLSQKILQKIAQEKASASSLQVRILVDYFMSEKQLPFLRLLDQNPNIEVRRYGAPTPSFIKLMSDLKIDGPKFVSGLMAQSGSQLKESLANVDLGISKDDLGSLDLSPEKNPFSWVAKALVEVESILKKAQVSKERVDAFVRELAIFLHRTHHKLLLVDGKCFQMGGRNLSDEYHAPMESKLIQGDESLGIEARKYPFVDLDVSTCLTDSSSYAESPLTQSYDLLWKDPRTVELSFEYTLAEKDKSILDAEVIDQKAQHARELLVASAPTVTLKNKPAPAIWVENMTGVQKIEESGKGLHEITTAYINMLKSVGKDEEIRLVNAYFYQDSEGWLERDAKITKGLKELHRALIHAAKVQKAKVYVYTNSIKTTDLSIVNVFAYPKYRELLEAGVKILELDEKQGALQKRASLHMKGGFARYLDTSGPTPVNQLLFLVGSYNLDPRSHARDTNNALLFWVTQDQQEKARADFLKALHTLNWSEVTPDSVGALEAVANEDSNKKTRLILSPYKFEL